MKTSQPSFCDIYTVSSTMLKMCLQH